jgi:hypothetical protein
MHQLDPEGRVQLGVWHWRPGVDGPGVPRTQTLERLVLGVLGELEGSRAYGAIVERFLIEEPRVEKLTSKHYAWATMAKWYGDRGCGDFYQALWRELAFAEAMLAALDGHHILPQARDALLEQGDHGRAEAEHCVLPALDRGQGAQRQAEGRVVDARGEAEEEVPRARGQRREDAGLGVRGPSRSMAHVSRCGWARALGGSRIAG